MRRIDGRRHRESFDRLSDSVVCVLTNGRDGVRTRERLQATRGFPVFSQRAFDRPLSAQRLSRASAVSPPGRRSALDTQTLSLLDILSDVASQTGPARRSRSPMSKTRPVSDPARGASISSDKAEPCGRLFMGSCEC